MNLYKINVKYKAMNLHSKFYILFVYNQRKMTKNLTVQLTSESILSMPILQNICLLMDLQICHLLQTKKMVIGTCEPIKTEVQLCKNPRPPTPCTWGSRC